MSGFESMIASYVLNSLWQVPLIFAAAWIAARVMRVAGPGAEHRVWVSALLAGSLIPAFSILPWQALKFDWPWRTHSASSADTQVFTQFGEGTKLTGLRLPPGLMTILVVVYLSLLLYFVARLIWRCTRLCMLIRRTEPLGDDSALLCTKWSHRFGIKRPISVVCSRETFAPVTMATARNWVVLPLGMATRFLQPDFDAAIAHEFAHIRRADFLKNVFYELLSLPVDYHPCLWLMRQRITETREMVCDEMAAEVSGKKEYAQSLLRLASLLLHGKPISIPQAIGVFDANTLERRLMRLTEKKNEIGRLRQFASLGACVVLGVAAATSAVALRIGVDQDSDRNAASKSIPTSISAEKMQEQVITKVPPIYPPDAKKARLQGTVVLEAVIGKEGHVENLKVVSGPSKLQQSALDSVRQWVYKPYLVNGQPVEVETTINVVYSLKK